MSFHDPDQYEFEVPTPKGNRVSALRVVPLELVEANGLIAAWHRHHQPVVGHRFSLGVVDEAGFVHGAAVVGRPVARMAGTPRAVAEVTRLVTDGTPNACSMLYAAAARACKALGFERIQTYILEDEPGTSLRAAGWEFMGTAGGGQWKHTDGRPRRTDQPTTPKGRWSKRLTDTQPALVIDTVEDGQEALWMDGPWTPLHPVEVEGAS